MPIKYNSLFSRSFSQFEQQKFGYGAVLGSLIFGLSFCIVFKPYMHSISILNLQLMMDSNLETLMLKQTIITHQAMTQPMEIKPICNLNEPRSDFCEINGNIMVHGKYSSISFTSPIPHQPTTLTIKPYARKENSAAMEHVKNWSLSPIMGHQKPPHCSSIHNIPAIIFSLGGFSGNHFHDFSDIVIPLYVTSQQFNGEVQFLVTDYKSWWVIKFHAILKKLSNYDIIDIDKIEETLCYPSLIIGLRSHNKELSIDSTKSPNGVSMKDFKEFLRSIYLLTRTKAIATKFGDYKRPRLLLISRKNSRTFTNKGRIIKTARSLGYDVVVEEANLSTNLSKFGGIVNSCDVLMGVHGAGLTNMVFLPENAIVIQIIPFGGIDKLARDDFEEPTKDMNIRYLEYEIRVKESSLIKQFPLDHVIFRDPISVHKVGWDEVKSIYLDKQNVKLDVHRFRGTLVKALEILSK